MGMTASTKDEFSTFVLETLKASKQIILDHDPDIVFDVDGHAAKMEAEEVLFKLEFGKIAVMEAAKMKQVKLVNVLRDKKYATASATTDAISGYMGKDDEISVLLHQKRESLSNPANRGPRTPSTKIVVTKELSTNNIITTNIPTTETTVTTTTPTDTPIV